MVKQLHKRFTDDQVKLLLDLYLRRAIGLQQVLQQLECTEGRFYQILRVYKRAPEEFTIAYTRHHPKNRLPEEVEKAIPTQLELRWFHSGSTTMQR